MPRLGDELDAQARRVSDHGRVAALGRDEARAAALTLLREPADDLLLGLELAHLARRHGALCGALLGALLGAQLGALRGALRGELRGELCGASGHARVLLGAEARAPARVPGAGSASTSY